MIVLEEEPFDPAPGQTYRICPKPHKGSTLVKPKPTSNMLTLFFFVLFLVLACGKNPISHENGPTLVGRWEAGDSTLGYETYHFQTDSVYVYLWQDDKKSLTTFNYYEEGTWHLQENKLTLSPTGCHENDMFTRAHCDPVAAVDISLSHNALTITYNDISMTYKRATP